MLFSRSLLICLLVVSLDAFSVVVQPRNVIRSSISPTTTVLYAEEDSEQQQQQQKQEQEAPSAEEEAKPAAAKSSSSSSDTDILNSPAFLKRKLEVIKSDIAKAEEELQVAKERLQSGKEEWGTQLDELQKEYKNIQQRMNAQSSTSDDRAITEVARSMLEVLDNFDRAFGQVQPSNEVEEAIAKEYQQVYDDILNVFTKLGIEEVKTVGTEFDYEVHQAVMQKPSEEYDEGIVCEELQKGFKIGNTLIRAAMVVVAF